MTTKRYSFSFRGAHHGQIDVEIADWIALELFPPGLVSFHLGKTADAMPFQTPMKGRTGQLRDRGLQGVEAVVERKQRVLAEGHDDGLLFDRQNR
jgi:hypothetical protein